MRIHNCIYAGYTSQTCLRLQNQMPIRIETHDGWTAVSPLSMHNC
uniref:Uncharacterized protein n=1 Tax=Anguilla anguilla TaxID=7936 RepID=A0A0E9PZK3_ANGAN